ncbi:hypothetical protein APHAL10511_006968 [Amanita phalloides]|nr:hypothetical protein APHAL10511_006968 [Amanita phalloides]
MSWIPNPFNLLAGPPFQYSDHTISSISGTEAFETGISLRDANSCVVEGDTWEEMRDHGFVPAAAKGVEHEARNGIRLCAIHHTLFDKHCYYIRWMPQERRFVLINHSRVESLEVYHGRAINLHEGDDRLPFHGAFLFHEMRVRGYWPLREDRAVPLPIAWVDWIEDDDGDNGDGGRRGRGRGRGHGRGRSRGHGRGRGRGRGHGRGGGNNHNHGPSMNETGSGRLLRSHGPVPGSSASVKVFIPTNPFADPTTLQALKESFAEQPNWKAAVMEGATWEGSADENAAKWRKLNRIDA